MTIVIETEHGTVWCGGRMARSLTFDELLWCVAALLLRNECSWLLNIDDLVSREAALRGWTQPEHERTTQDAQAPSDPS